MRRSLWAASAIAACIWMAACGDDSTSPAPDSSLATDTGAEDAGADTGAPIDAGTDAGRDAGMDSGPLHVDAGPCDALPAPTGEPITAPPMEWTYVEFPGTRCMDGSSTGIGVNPNPDSTRVMIFLEGGNACFDEISCLAVAHIDGFGPSEFRATASYLRARLFNRTDENNPVRDWSFVFVPYCSGDVHAGNNDSGAMGLAHHGFDNMTQYLQRLVPTFAHAELVLLAGESAGGFGAAYNYDQTQQAFGCTPVYLLDDAGPPMADPYLRPCLQRLWRDVWGLDSTLPDDCPGCSNDDRGGIVNLVRYVVAKYPDRRFAILSTTEDRTIRTFYGYGYARGCNFPSLMPAADFTAGLLDLRDRVVGSDRPNFGMFLMPGERHTLLGGPLDGLGSGGVTLAEWIRRLVEDDPSWGNTGP